MSTAIGMAERLLIVARELTQLGVQPTSLDVARSGYHFLDPQEPGDPGYYPVTDGVSFQVATREDFDRVAAKFGMREGVVPTIAGTPRNDNKGNLYAHCHWAYIPVQMYIARSRYEAVAAVA